MLNKNTKQQKCHRRLGAHLLHNVRGGPNLLSALAEHAHAVVELLLVATIGFDLACHKAMNPALTEVSQDVHKVSKDVARTTLCTQIHIKQTHYRNFVETEDRFIGAKLFILHNTVQTGVGPATRLLELIMQH